MGRSLFLDLPGRDLRRQGDAASWILCENDTLHVHVAESAGLSRDYAWAIHHLCGDHHSPMPMPGQTVSFAEDPALTKRFRRRILEEFATENQVLAFMIGSGFSLPMDGFLEGRDYQITGRQK